MLEIVKPSLLWGHMPAAPQLLATDFGDWLEKLRRGESYEAIAVRIRPLLPGRKVSRSQIEKWEKGRVPDWPALAALSVVYHKDLMAMALRLAKSLPNVTTIVTKADKSLSDAFLSYKVPEEKPLESLGPGVAELGADARTVVAILNGMPDADKAIVGQTLLELGMALVEPESARATATAARTFVRPRANKPKDRRRGTSNG